MYVSGGKKFKDLESAKAFAEAKFEKTGVIVAIEEAPKKLTKKQLKAIAYARINRAVVGFRIPMLSIPKLYKSLEEAIANEKTDEDLKAIVAAFPGVEIA